MYTYFLAFRYMAKRITAYLAVISFTIGVAVLIIVTSVMSGFAEDMKEKIRGTGSHLIVQKGLGKFIPDYPELMKKISEIDHVTGVSPRIKWPVLYTLEGFGGSNRLHFGILTGIDPEQEIHTTNISDYVEGGKVHFEYRDGSPGHPGILRGARPSPNGNVQPTYYSRTSTPMLYRVSSSKMTGKKKELQEQFEVVGTYSSGMYDFDNRRLYCSLKAAQDFLHIKDYVTEIAVAVDEYNNDRVLDRVKENISFLLQDRRGYHSRSVQTWKNKRSGLLQAVKAERGLTTILLFLVVVIAAFMLLAVLSMMVMEKRRDIGILRSLGGTVRGVAGIFLFEGFVIGLIGTLAGLVLGWAIVSNLNPIADFIKTWTGWHPFPSDVYILDKIPSVWEPYTVFLIGFLTILISLVFSLIPAYKASKLEPIEAIRYE